MTERERLIELLDGADLFLRNRAEAAGELNCYDIEYLNDIAKVCDEAARTLEKAIVPPCKVGDKVYYISENPLNLSVQANTLYEADVVRIVTTHLGTSLVIQIHNEYGCTEIPDVNEWGKTVFLSVEEFTKRCLDTADLEKAVEHLTKCKELKEAEQALRKEDGKNDK